MCYDKRTTNEQAGPEIGPLKFLAAGSSRALITVGMMTDKLSGYQSCPSAVMCKERTWVWPSWHIPSTAILNFSSVTVQKCQGGWFILDLSCNSTSLPCAHMTIHYDGCDFISASQLLYLKRYETVSVNGRDRGWSVWPPGNSESGEEFAAGLSLMLVTAGAWLSERIITDMLVMLQPLSPGGGFTIHSSKPPWGPRLSYPQCKFWTPTAKGD